MPFGRRKVRWVAAACLALAVAAPTAGCSKEGSDNKPSAQSQGSAEAKTPVTGTEGRQPTLGDYIEQNKITEAQVSPGQPGTPEIALPMGPGWKDLGTAKPPYSYAAIINTDPAYNADPPSVVVLLSKLSGKVDQTEILALAPNEVRNLPNFKGVDPVSGTVSGFDSTQISGTYVRDGKTRLIGQKTVVIPKGDTFFVLQINADGLTDQADVLTEATAALDKSASIKLP